MKIITLLLLSFLFFSTSVSADYGEECLSEGCSNHEVWELYQSYKEECLNEGCSKEEVIELAGGPQHVVAMLQAFRDRGYKIDDSHLPVGNCRATGTKTACGLFLLFCKDYYFCPGGGPDLCQPGDLFCPGGNTTSSWYVCGGCIGWGF